MCLSVPAKLIEVNGARGVADADGNRITVSLELVDGASVGDYVLVHTGYAIQLYDREEAEATIALLREALDGDP